MSHTKVLVIGLDGVPLDLIQGWANEGLLPTFKSIINEGAVGPLKSTIPPTSGPSWSSFVTGKNPGKTGIYDFLYRKEGTYRFPPVNASRRDGKSIWRLLSEDGKRVGVINVPVSYPVEKVNGFVISGWMTPFNARDFTYPPNLHAELVREVGNYRIYPTETFAEERTESFFRACDELLDLLTRATLHLTERYPWDFFITVFFDTDRVLHQLWHYLDPGHPWRTREDREDKSSLLKRYFRKLDDSIAQILSRTDEDTLVMIMSDHGMGPAYNFIVLNNWLLETGLLKLKSDPFRGAKRLLFDHGFTLRNIHKLADKLGLSKHVEYKGLYSWDYLMKLAFLSFLDVDWAKSKAYSFGRHVGSTYVNLKGREPRGSVSPGQEYEMVRNEIEGLAKEFRHPKTGRLLIGEILRKEDIYHGPYLDQAPDLILRPADERDIFFGLADFGSNLTVDTVYRYSGMHRDYGLLMVKGKGVKPGWVEGAQIVDLAPTILYALGTPIPSDMDGKPLLQVFKDDHVREAPPLYSDRSSATGTGPDTGYTKEAEREIQERLRGLGYLG